MRRLLRRFLLMGEKAKNVFLWNATAASFDAVVSVVMLFLATRLVSLEQAGVLALAIAMGQQLICVGRWGMRNFQTADVGEQYTLPDYLVSRAVTNGLMVVCGCIWAFMVGGSWTKMAAILLVVVQKILESWSTIFEGRYQQKLRLDVAARGVIVKTGGALVVFATICLSTRNIVLALAGMSVAYFALMLATDGILLPLFGGFSLRSTLRTQGSLLLACFPLFINAFLQMYINNAQKFAIDKQMDDASVAIFSILLMLSFVILLLSSSILAPMIAPASEAYEHGHPRAFWKMVWKQFLILGVLGVLLIGGGWLCGVPVLSAVFGVPLDGMRRPLCLLLLGGVLLASYYVLQLILIVRRRQYVCLIGIGLAALFTFLCTTPLVARHGILGAATSYLSAMAILFFATLLLIPFFPDHRGAGR